VLFEHLNTLEHTNDSTINDMNDANCRTSMFNDYQLA